MLPRLPTAFPFFPPPSSVRSSQAGLSHLTSHFHLFTSYGFPILVPLWVETPYSVRLPEALYLWSPFLPLFRELWNPSLGSTASFQLREFRFDCPPSWILRFSDAQSITSFPIIFRRTAFPEGHKRLHYLPSLILKSLERCQDSAQEHTRRDFFCFGSAYLHLEAQQY